MNHKLVILGHHNFGLSLLMENFYKSYGTNINVSIIMNRDPEENKLKDYPFALPETSLEIIKDDDWTPGKGEVYFNSAMSPGSRKSLFMYFKERFGLSTEQYGNSIHPQSNVALSAHLASGIYIAPGSCISPFTEIGDFVLFNRISSIGHHSVVKSYSNICPGVNIASGAKIGEGVFIGTGATIIENISIGAGSIIGANSLVVTNIPENVVAYGSPAKVIRDVK